MERIGEFKSFYRDKTMEELDDDTKKWKAQIEFLQYDFDFLKSLLDSDIYNAGIINLFETLQLYKAQVEDTNKEALKVSNKLMSHQEHIKTYLECDDINCDYFFMEIHAKMEYDVAVFLQESNTMKLQLFEYIKSVIKK